MCSCSDWGSLIIHFIQWCGPNNRSLRNGLSLTRRNSHHKTPASRVAPHSRNATSTAKYTQIICKKRENFLKISRHYKLETPSTGCNVIVSGRKHIYSRIKRTLRTESPSWIFAKPPHDLQNDNATRRLKGFHQHQHIKKVQRDVRGLAYLLMSMNL